MTSFQSECEDWTETAKMLTSQLLNESIEALFPAPVLLEDKFQKSRAESTATEIILDKPQDSSSKIDSTISMPETQQMVWASLLYCGNKTCSYTEVDNNSSSFASLRNCFHGIICS